MSTEAHKADVLRLKELLDHLRLVLRPHLPSNASIDQIAKVLGIDWSITRRFWEMGRAGGPIVIRAVKTKTGENSVCDEALTLVERMSDKDKSLIPYSVGAINLVFDIGEALEKVRAQLGLTSREKMTVAQFAAFFGQDREFVQLLMIGNRDVLKSYDAEKDSRISSVLESNDWTTIRPKKSEKPVPKGKAVELKNLIGQIRPQFPSDYAMLKTMGIHRASLKNALAGKGKDEVLNNLLRKVKGMALSQTRITQPVAPNTSSRTPTEVQDSGTFIGSFVSSLNSFVRMGEAAGINPASFTDGQRDNLIRIMAKLATIANIDGAAIKRLKSTEGLAADDPGLNAVLSVLGRAKR